MSHHQPDITFQVCQKIGEGTYGIVYKMVDSDGTEYAYKRFLSQLTTATSAYTEFAREADILNRFKGNPRIVQLKMISVGCPKTEIPLSPLRCDDESLNDDLLHFIFENAQSNLRCYITKQITFVQMKQFMVDILLGVESISLSGVLHRDLNPANILVFEPSPDPLTPDTKEDNKHTPISHPDKVPITPIDSGSLYRAKICDFGLSIQDVDDHQRTPGTVTALYRAPEIIGCHDNYSTKSDAWSVGCIFFELLFREAFLKGAGDNKGELITALFRNATYLFSEYEINYILKCDRRKQTGPTRPIKKRMLSSKPVRYMIISSMRKITRNQVTVNQPPDPVTAKIIDDFSAVIESLLIVDPAKRSSVSEVLDMEFFADYRDYIRQFRETYPPRTPYEYQYDIRPVNARQKVIDYIISIFNQRANHDWYSHRSYFHAIDLFDRCIRYQMRADKPIKDKEEGKLFFFACLYHSIRYFSTLSSPVEITDVVPNHIQRDKASMKRLIEIESIIIFDVVEYSFYRHSIYEAIVELTLPNDYPRDLLYREAVIFLCQKTGQLNGITPTELAIKIYENHEQIHS